MPNFSGIWTVTQQMQARGASTWPATPGAPTIGTATAGNTQASVTFTAPACTGYPAGITAYRVISTPGCFSNTGASSPIVVTGLTNGTAYTFKAQASNSLGYGGLSSASNSVTPNATCATYTSSGTYSWVAPSGVTSVSVVAVGGGGSEGFYNYGCGFAASGGGGGGLAYANNISVTPGSSYTVIAGAKGNYSAGGNSKFNTNVEAQGGRQGSKVAFGSGTGGAGGTVVTGTGGSGGAGGDAIMSGFNAGGGGGGGGYAGAGGRGGDQGSSSGRTNGSGGGGAGANQNFVGGGVGIFGQGASGSSASAGGSGGVNGCSASGGCWGGGSGGNCAAARGAVRIVWPGTTRQFPSTCVGA